MSDSELTTLIQRKQEAKSTLAKIQTRIAEVAKPAITEGFKVLFAAHPCLKTVSWTQYTPSFNDGDPCVFGSSHDYPEINEDDDDYTDWDEDEESEEGEDDEANEAKSTPAVEYSRSDTDAAEDAVRSFLKQFDEDDMAAIFGDSSKVIVCRKGIKVEEYYD